MPPRPPENDRPHKTPLSEYEDHDLINALITRTYGQQEDAALKQAAIVVAAFQHMAKYVFPLHEMLDLAVLIAQALRLQHEVDTRTATKEVTT